MATVEMSGSGKMIERDSSLRENWRTKGVEYISRTGHRVVVFHESVSALLLIQEVVYDFDPELIIELGTSMAGLTLVFHEAKPDIPLFTFDNLSVLEKYNPGLIPESSLKDTLRKAFNQNVYFVRAELISPPLEFLRRLLEWRKKKILYCDNGHKATEIALYSEYLNSGDMLGVHDWNREIKGQGYLTEKEIEIVENRLVIFREFELNIKFEKAGYGSRFWIRE